MKKLAAVLIENRLIDNVADVCNRHMRYLPEDTDLFIHTSPGCIEPFTKQLESVNLTAKFLTYNSNLPTPLELKYIPGLNELLDGQNRRAIFNLCLEMTSTGFWKQYFEYERVLIFQPDSTLLRKGIERFYVYDYIGAPCFNFINNQTVQNGGLSLRNPRVMEYICRMHGWKDDLDDLMKAGQYSTASFFAEDIFFCLRMIKYNIGKLAPIEIAEQFSIESRFKLGSLGYHKIEAYLTQKEQELVNHQYLLK